VRLRATAIQAAATGDRLLGQRVLVAQRPAATADAPGGVRALTEATDAAIDELAQWLTQLR
jgi:cholesterol transport system auxiliary component